jgi:hypothetical protein
MVAGLSGRAAAQDARAVIDRAIKATAGTDDELAKQKVCVHTSRGAMRLRDDMVPARREAFQALPDRIKWVAEVQGGGRTAPYVITLNGLRGWMVPPGGTQTDLSQAMYESLVDETYFTWVTTLIPLKERAVTLSLLPDDKVDGRPARGVKVTARGRGEVILYFDAASDLLVKGVFKVREAGLEVTRESVFSDHRRFEGLMLPTRQVVTQNRQKIQEWTYDGYRFPERIDPAVFAKP